MPKIYLRVKHFVAAWARHNYGGSADDPGRELNLAQIHDALMVLNLVQMNTNDKVIPQCYCERQWARMMNGEHIAKDSDVFLVDVRDKNVFLTEQEVCEYAGVEPMRGDGMGDYVCIPIPDEVYDRQGQPHRTNSQWQLMHDAAVRLEDILTAAFDDALFDYIDQSLRDAKKMNMDRYTSDALEAFMSRNDIRNCADDREKRCLWRRYYRYLEREVAKNAKDAEDADAMDEEFYTGKERRRQRERRANSGRAVMCLQTGKQWPSIFTAAHDQGIGYTTLYMAIKRGTRCRGMQYVFSSADT